MLPNVGLPQHRLSSLAATDGSALPDLYAHQSAAIYLFRQCTQQELCNPYIGQVTAVPLIRLHDPDLYTHSICPIQTTGPVARSSASLLTDRPSLAFFAPSHVASMSPISEGCAPLFAPGKPGTPFSPFSLAPVPCFLPDLLHFERLFARYTCLRLC
jgi:hypothetical protein